MPLELGALILVVLLAGPLSWDHYFVWAVIPITLMVDLDLWRRRTRGELIGLVVGIGAGVSLLHQSVTSPTTTGPEPNWTLRVISSPYTLATLVLIGVAWRLLLQPIQTAELPQMPQVEPEDEQRTRLT